MTDPYTEIERVKRLSTAGAPCICREQTNFFRPCGHSVPRIDCSPEVFKGRGANKNMETRCCKCGGVV